MKKIFLLKKNNLALFWALFLLIGSLTAQAQHKSLDPGTAFKTKLAEHRNLLRKQSEYDQKIPAYVPVRPPSLTRFKVSQEALRSNACPPGDVFLANQDDVDAFGALGCTEVTGNLIIDDSGSSPKITNLTPLSSLNTVTGIFQVTAAQLSSLAGLSSLNTVGYLHIIGCSALTNMSGLSGLTECNGPVVNPCSCAPQHNFIRDNASLVSLTGLSNLGSVNSGLFFYDNPSLQSVNGLSGLSYIGGALVIQNNASLKNVHGLSSLTTVVRDLVVRQCPALKNLIGLQNLSSVGIWCIIENNNLLKNMVGLSGLTSIGGRLMIDNNATLKNLEGLSALTTVGELVWVENNATQKNLEGLSSLTSTNGIIAYFLPELQNLNGLPGLTNWGVIDIFECASLKNIDALSNVTGIDVYILLQGLPSLKNINGLSNLAWVGETFGMAVCPSITNIDALSNLTVVDGLFGIILMDNLQNLDGLSNLTSVGQASGDDLWIFENHALTSCCGIYQLLCADPPTCSADAVGGSVVIFNNGASCTEADIKAGGPCSSQFSPPVEDRSVNGDAAANSTVFSVYPNPATSQVTVELGDVEGAAMLSVFDVLGRQVAQRQIEAGVVRFDMELPKARFPVGKYFVRLATASEVLTRVLVVQ